MSVSSVPLNGVNGGVFAFEEEPSTGTHSGTRQGDPILLIGPKHWSALAPSLLGGWHVSQILLLWLHITC
jgi:hypothetical protein